VYRSDSDSDSDTQQHGHSAHDSESDSDSESESDEEHLPRHAHPKPGRRDHRTTDHTDGHWTTESVTEHSVTGTRLTRGPDGRTHTEPLAGTDPVLQYYEHAALRPGGFQPERAVQQMPKALWTHGAHNPAPALSRQDLEGIWHGVVLYTNQLDWLRSKPNLNPDIAENVQLEFRWAAATHKLHFKALQRHREETQIRMGLGLVLPDEPQRGDYRVFQLQMTTHPSVPPFNQWLGWVKPPVKMTLLTRGEDWLAFYASPIESVPLPETQQTAPSQRAKQVVWVISRKLQLSDADWQQLYLSMAGAGYEVEQARERFHAVQNRPSTVPQK
jgi:hypothetical protein